MPQIHQIETERLLLRQWQASDFQPFAALNADAETMRYFPATLSRAQSDAFAQRLHDLIAERGWGLWAAQSKATGRFIGFIGLHVPAVPMPFSPCVEVGWRLLQNAWGQGFATEGARAALDFAFTTLQLQEVVSFTAVLNTRSERVMQRLGMQRDAHTFLHPAIADGHPLQEHCLYRAKAQ